MPSWSGRDSAENDLIIADTSGVALERIPATVRQRLQFLCSRLDLHDDGVPASVGVTSAVSGEGVSFISRGLAAVLSQDLDRSTCLVDTNWWSTDDDSADRTDGLAEVIRDGSPIDDVLVPTMSGRLWVLRSGTVPEGERTKLAMTDAMAGVIGELRTWFDHIILDLPATATSTAAMNFAAAADASLIVARQQMTREDQVERAAADLRHTRLLGIVLNDFHLSMPKSVQHRLLDA